LRKQFSKLVPCDFSSLSGLNYCPHRDVVLKTGRVLLLNKGRYSYAGIVAGYEKDGGG
jgi:hypothetical protein